MSSNELIDYAQNLSKQEAATLAALLKHPIFSIFIQPYIQQFLPDHSLPVPESSGSIKKNYGFSQTDFILGHNWFGFAIDWHVSEFGKNIGLYDHNSPFFSLDLDSRLKGKNMFYNMERASLLVELHTHSTAYVGRLPFSRIDHSQFSRDVSKDFLKQLINPRMLAANDLISQGIASNKENQLFVSPQGDVWLTTDIESYRNQRPVTEDYLKPNLVDEVMKIRQETLPIFSKHRKVDVRYRRVGDRPMLIVINETLNENQLFPKWKPAKLEGHHLEEFKEVVSLAETAGYVRNDNKALTSSDLINGILMHFPGDITFNPTH